VCGSLKGKLFHATKENIERKQVAYLTARLEKTVLSEKMIEEDLSRVEESAPKFVPSSNYHKKEEALKPTKTHYPSNPKPSFTPKRYVKKEILKPREEAFVCMLCGCSSHLDEFCFNRKRIEKRRFDYATNSYHDEFSNFLPRSYSCALPRTSSHASSRFSHGPNHHSYGFGCERTTLCVGMVYLLEDLTLTLS
jgi:hypothetical protein